MKNKPRDMAVQPPQDENNETLLAINEPEEPPELTKAHMLLDRLYKKNQHGFADAAVAVIKSILNSANPDSIPDER